MDKPPISLAAYIREARRQVMRGVSEAEKKLTPREIEKTMRARFGTDKRMFRAALKSLLEDNEIVYSYTFGNSFIEKSMNKPVRISNRIVLKPPDMSYRPSSNEAVIDLRPGASFGSGDHPTTRLAVRGIDHVLADNEHARKNGRTRSLDIGTGSGILAIVAVSLGIERAVGIDMDPCALAEARQNVRMNRLERRIEISDQGVEKIDEKFSLITANLRAPTIKRLCSRLNELLEPDGCIVVSGVRTGEIRDLSAVFNRNGLQCAWKDIEKSWAGLAFDRNKPA